MIRVAVTARRWRGLRVALSAGALATALLAASEAPAFVHVVQPGETLAQIATRVYGDPKLEVVLAGANGLDIQGSAPVAGMRLDVPAPGYYRVHVGDTWGALALIYLGDAKRADVLARVNHGVSWIPPVDGQEIQIPYVLTFIASDTDRVDQIAARYMHDANRAWELDAYNGRKGVGTAPPPALHRGDVVLVPLLDLTLTEAGKAEAARGSERAHDEAGGAELEAQRRAEAELPLLLADVRGGRYVEAVARGNRVLGSGALAKTQLAVLHRALLEAYVALDASGAAAGACAAWRALVPNAKLDAAMVSPKIRAACPPAHGAR